MSDVFLWTPTHGACPRGVMVKEMGCEIPVNEFVRYYVHFRENTLGKGMNPLILEAMTKIATLLFFYENGFDIK